MKKVRIFLLGVLMPGLFLGACKKDDNTPEGLTYKQPVGANKTEVIAIPAGLQAQVGNPTSYGATLAVNIFTSVNAFATMGHFFVIPEGAQVQSKKNGTKVYTWTNNGFSVWMTYEELGDKYTWKYEYETPEIAKFTYLYAEELKTGKGGSWDIYNPEEPQQNDWTYDWSINSTNTFTASLVQNSGSGAATFDLVINSDKSGSMKYYIGSELNALIEMNANGSGSYTFYGDTSVLSGSWTAK